MKFLLKFLVRTLIIMAICHFLPGITIFGEGSELLKNAALVAIVLGLLNTFVKPILVFFTIPITFLTLGLFLLVINAIIVEMADYFLTGFHVDGFVTAIIFSVLLSIVSSVVEWIIGDNNR